MVGEEHVDEVALLFEVGELAHGRRDVGVDPHSFAEALASVDDPVADRVGLPQRVKCRAQLIRVHLRARRPELPRGDRRVLAVEQHELEAAGAGVDDQDAHRPAYACASCSVPGLLGAGQHQSVTSGGSSPCSRV